VCDLYESVADITTLRKKMGSFGSAVIGDVKNVLEDKGQNGAN
jgi:hypothetical protein